MSKDMAFGAIIKILPSSAALEHGLGRKHGLNEREFRGGLRHQTAAKQ